MGIVAEDIDRVRAATDIVALVSERVALRRVGTRWVGLCPFHSEKSPSFSVNGELGLYYCFGCQARGDAITWLRELDHMDFVGAVEALAARTGTSLRYDEDATAGTGRKRQAELAEVMEAAVTWYHERLLHSPDAGPARAYLRRQRGYDAGTVRQFRLGWAPEGWDVLVRRSGLPPELAVEAGLAFRNQAGRLTDSFRGRVIFPIYDAGGRAVGLGGRALPGTGGPKYKNTQGTALYDKSRVLYGLNWAKSSIVERGQVVVCEGYTDVIGLHRAGVTEAVATCGTALAEGHVKLLVGFSRRIVLAYDADTAGQGAADKFYDWERRFDAEISVVTLPPGMDPAELAQQGPEALHQAVSDASPYLGFRLKRLFAAADMRNPEGRARAAELAVGLIAEHPDSLVRDQYLMEVADRCRLGPDQLRDVLARGEGRAPSTGPARGAGRRDARPAEGGGHGGTPDRPGAARREQDRPGQDRPRRDRPGQDRPGQDRPGQDRPGQDRPGPAVPPPELEALRLAVHQPELVAERLHSRLFRSELGQEAFERLASSMTLHEAVEQAPAPVADLLARLAVAGPVEQPDDVVRRLLDRAAAAELDRLRRRARSAPEVAPGPEELAALSERAVALQMALGHLRSAGTEASGSGLLAGAEAQLLALLLGSASTSSGPAA